MRTYKCGSMSIRKCMNTSKLMIIVYEIDRNSFRFWDDIRDIVILMIILDEMNGISRKE
jgi:hypothetical protein